MSRSAQVAPLPRTEDFHVGKLLNDDGGQAHSTELVALDAAAVCKDEQETSYIPVALAKVHLAKVVADMHVMKEEQALKVAQIIERYNAIERDTQAHYESVVLDVKRHAKRKLQDEQRKYEALVDLTQEQQAQAQYEYAELLTQCEQEHVARDSEKESWCQQFEARLLLHEEEMAKCHAMVTLELQREAARHDRAANSTLEQLRNELQLSWEDAKSESMRVVQQLEHLRKEMLVKEKAFVRRVQQMQTAFDADHEVLKCLNSVVNRVVDMAQQQAARKKTKELTHEITKLNEQVRKSIERESNLQQRLQVAREQYTNVERSAVRETVEWIVQTIEVAAAMSLPLPSAAVSSQMDEPEATVAPIVAVDPPQFELTVTQLQHASDVERLRERNREIVHSKQRLHDEKVQLQTLLESKNAAKASIKMWLAEFQHEHGRDPTIEDKALVKDLYLRFKESEEAYNRQKAHVAALKAQHHAKVIEIEAIAQWQVLTGAVLQQQQDARRSDNFGECPPEEDGRMMELFESSSSYDGASRSSSASGFYPCSRPSSSVDGSVPKLSPRQGKVSALEYELELLRQELAAVNANNSEKKHGAADKVVSTTNGAGSAADQGVSGDGSVGEVHIENEFEDLFAGQEGGDFAEPPVVVYGEEENADKGSLNHLVEEMVSASVPVSPLPTMHEKEAKSPDELVVMQPVHEVESLERNTSLSQEQQQQQAALQLTIDQLASEIELRREEKQRLETQIEQLRLHLELMEFHHDDPHSEMDPDDSLSRPSDERVDARRQSKRVLLESQHFDEEEAVDDDEEDGADEYGDAKGGRENRPSWQDEELLDANESNEQDDGEQSGNEGDDDEESGEEEEGVDAVADTKDSGSVPSSPLKLQLDARDDIEDEVEVESPEDKEDAARWQHMIAVFKGAIEQGKAQFNRGDRTKCYQTYLKAIEKCMEQLRGLHHPSRREDVAACKHALGEASRLPAARGSMVLRKQLDVLLADCEARLRDRDERLAASQERLLLEKERKAAQAATIKLASTPPHSVKKHKHHAHKKATPPGTVALEENDGGSSAKSNAISILASSSSGSTPGKAASNAGGGKVLEEYKQKLKALETKAKADKVKITQLETSLAKLESQQFSMASGGSGASNGGASSAVLERKLGDMEKKHKHALEDAEKTMKKEVSSLSQQLQAAQSKSTALQAQVTQCESELARLGGKATQLSRLEGEIVGLRQQAAQATAFAAELQTVKTDFTKLEVSYREEQSLRKKYYNMIEDMKGKIRVYARCRPMSSSERDRGCGTCVKFVDEYSVELETPRGPKPFSYDQVFSPVSTQDQVFEDTKNLLQSALDGFNVCIFAYGQTGSGKTFTMTGTETMPGLSPRAITHLFTMADEAKSNHTVTFQAFMLELYNDTLIDLFHLVDSGGGHDNLKDAPKLEIKKNDKGMVFVQNITMKTCTNAQQTLKLFELANKKRQVGSTKMNAESSRSHSVFSLLVENYNKTTKATSIGKLSLVDLAGSERAGKTGATAERLKEAQAINKSLSALGDVISALSTNEKFIPYRNNKLTQLMQDSLGGNAKTLMFVNISPADYNQEETQTSLAYASRVKLITNSANKNSESELVNRLKLIIKQLKAGKSDVDLEGVLE
uniref:Kinesin motor domain-containing protein n=1 Tax=Globisporangium ultimum (strain ATCC 200006 / CBS 805.95 / DAOM BR144) TaxID=431595 RepID=K3W8F7_GLOUD